MAQGVTPLMYRRQHFAIVEDLAVDFVELTLSATATVCICTAVAKALRWNNCRHGLAAAYALRMVGVQLYIQQLRKAPRTKLSLGNPVVWSVGGNSAW